MTKMAAIEFEDDVYAIVLDDVKDTDVSSGELVICETMDGYITVGKVVVSSFYTDSPEDYASNYNRQIIDTDLIGVYKCDLWKRNTE